MGCLHRLLNWFNNDNIPTSEKSILRDLQTIGIIPE